MGIERALDARTIWHAETDPAASAVLAEHRPDVPNLGDIKEVVPAIPAQVDILCAGYP